MNIEVIIAIHVKFYYVESICINIYSISPCRAILPTSTNKDILLVIIFDNYLIEVTH